MFRVMWRSLATKFISVFLGHLDKVTPFIIIFSLKFLPKFILVCNICMLSMSITCSTQEGLHNNKTF